MFFTKKLLDLPQPGEALPGRAQALPTAASHFVNGHALAGPYPAGFEVAEFGMGCFWGVERIFWKLPGVWVTAVGYSGGLTPNPTYEEVCSGRTGQNETVLVVFDPAAIAYTALLKTFWESHDPTQGMRQGGDRGTQYRSAIYTHTPEQAEAAQAAKSRYEAALKARGLGPITTEINPPAPSISRRLITSSIWPRTPAAIAASAGRGLRAPKVRVSRPDQGAGPLKTATQVRVTPKGLARLAQAFPPISSLVASTPSSIHAISSGNDGVARSFGAAFLVGGLRG